MSRPVIEIIVSCTARKSLKIPRFSLARNLRKDNLSLRFDQWCERLSNPGNESRKAQDLYCGNSWSEIRVLTDTPIYQSRFRLWIASAGHGLTSFDEYVPAYSATFSPGQIDSVIPLGLKKHHKNSDWWNLLIQYRRGTKKPFSIAELAKRNPKHTFLVVLSSEYLKALEEDLIAARDHLNSSNSLVIIASGGDKMGSLSENLLPCDSRLEHRYGRPRTMLNARILRAVVESFSDEEINYQRLEAYFRRILSPLPASVYPTRTKVDDESVRAYILREVDKDRSLSSSSLLQKYRGTGKACEQKRFRDIFKKVLVQRQNGN